MNKNIAQGKWQEFKGEMRKLWGDLTDNELEQTHGNVQAIGGLMNQKYGQMKDDARIKYDSLVERYGDEAVDKSGNVKESLRSDVNKH